MSITIREIAARAGVTKSTVSKVLNDRPGVGQETRNRVLAIMEQTGFRPSSAARALARGSTENIGLLIPREAGLALNGAYWSALTTSITIEAAARGHNVLMMTPGEDGDETELVEEAVSHRKAEGLIIALPRLAVRSLTLLAERGFPFVTVGRMPGWENRAVDVDNAGGGRDMGRYMLERGFRRIAVITGPESLLHMRERVRGFREAMAEHGTEAAAVVYSDFDEDSVDKAMNRALSETGTDALFVASGGGFLMQALRYMELNGIDRRNLGLTVFDDYPYLEFTEPAITAVRQPTEELGQLAVAELDRLIAGEGFESSPGEESRILRTEIVPRRSCGE